MNGSLRKTCEIYGYYRTIPYTKITGLRIFNRRSPCTMTYWLVPPLSHWLTDSCCSFVQPIHPSIPPSAGVVRGYHTKKRGMGGGDLEERHQTKLVFCAIVSPMIGDSKTGASPLILSAAVIIPLRAGEGEGCQLSKCSRGLQVAAVGS